MERTIEADVVKHGQFAERPRHTMQIDWYVYEHDIWNREIPAGRERAARGMAPTLAGRARAAEAEVDAGVLRDKAEEQPV
jgi:hypothetical protein